MQAQTPKLKIFEFRVRIAHRTEFYKFPRLSAIKTIIAGPAVITRNKEINCNKVVRLKNIIKFLMLN